MRERVEGRKKLQIDQREGLPDSLCKSVDGEQTERQTNTGTGERKPETETREILDEYNERKRDREYQTEAERE